MDMAFPNLSRWLWSEKHHQEPVISNGSSMHSSADSVTRELDVLRFPFVKEENDAPSSPRKVKHKWLRREDQKIDMECDFVIVPSDGGCGGSDSESVDSDWSIGWLEPHGSGFSSGDADNDSHETDSSFAVLVPCYGYNYGAVVEEDPKSNLLSNVGYFSDGKSSFVILYESLICSVVN